MKVFTAIMGLVLFTGMAWSFGEFYGTGLQRTRNRRKGRLCSC